MTLREMCIDLLRKEAAMLETWQTEEKEVPTTGKAAGKAVIYALCAVAGWLGKGWVIGMRDAAAAGTKPLMILLFGILGWVGWAVVIACGLLAVAKLLEHSEWRRQVSAAKKYNQELAQSKAECRRVYDALLAKVKAEREKHPELAGKHLFFDDPHPLERSDKLVRGKRIREKGRLMAVEGDLALDIIDGKALRLNGFYGPKLALIGEVCKGLKSPYDKYALPIWDKEYIDANPDAQCLLYTIQLYRIKAAPRDTRESKIEDPAAEYSRYWTEDTIGGFVASGIGDMKNLSSVKDVRWVDKWQEMNAYGEELKKNSEKLQSAEGRRHGWNVMDHMRMGYLMVSADGSKRMLGVILPRRELERHVFVYSLDLFYSEKEAVTKKMGQVMDVFRDVSDTRGLGPDIIDALWTALNCPEAIAPPFDPLQCPVQNLSNIEWHALLRLQAKECKE